MNKLVIVVDDDADIREALGELLRDQGYVVEMAANGREGLEVIRRTSGPRTVLLDMMMPVMDGFELMDVLQRTEDMRSLQIIVLTASAANVEKARAVIRKPASMSHILVAVAEAFDGQKPS